MSIQALLADMSDRTIAQRVGLAHDEARMAYPLRSNTVRSWDEYCRHLGHYVQHHYARCVAPGGRLDFDQAVERAKDIINRENHRQGGNVVSNYEDCRDGVNGGLRQTLDVLCEAMKAEAVEYYTRAAFDRYMPPHDWEQRKRMVSQFIQHCGVTMPGIDPSDPGRYARDLDELIRAFLRGLRQMSSIFRRL